MPSRASFSRGLRRAQRGVALIALLAVIMLGSAWMLITRLNEGSASFTAQNRIRNAEVLNRAKLALIGYVAQKVATDSNPGRLPCPEAVNNIGTSSEGSSAPWVPLPSTSTCASIGRLPWRTLGLEKLVDAAGEPLWYVVGPTWRLTTSFSSLVINSSTAGDVLVDSQQVVALIIAPGAAMNVQASTGCTARNQSRNTPAPAMDARDYLECFDSTTLQFITTAASTSFNDQVLRITTVDVLPAIEAAVARRIESEIVPVLQTVYADATWGTSSTSPAFPFPAPFGDPTTSDFQGDATKTQGLLPFNYHSSSCPVGDNRCSSNAITWGTPSLSSSGGPGFLPSSPTCTFSGSTSYCYGYYRSGTLNISIADPATNITTGLRTVNVTNHTGSSEAWRYTDPSGPWVYLGSQSATVSRNLGSNGAANFNASVALPSVPNWGYYYIYNNRPSDSAFSDHAILNSAGATTGWFVRNEWYRLLYYAIAPNHAPGGSLSCSDTGAITCLQVTNLTDPSKQRAILALAGRALTTTTPSQTRPSSDLQNYLDSVENRNLDSIFVQSTVSRSFNDRLISLSKNP